MIQRSRSWLWLLLLVPMALGLWRLRFDVEVLNLLPPESSVVQGLKLYQQNFANARELVITLSAPDAEQAESAAHTIALALRARPDLIAEATWTPPWQEHPGQSAELMAYLWLNQPPELFHQLTNRLSGEALRRTLRESQEALATSLSPNDLAMRGYDPLGLMQLPESATAAAPSMGSGAEFFASTDGTFRVVFAEASSELAGYKQCSRWLADVQQVIEGARSPEDFSTSVTVRYTGRPAFVAEIGSGMERDLAGPSVGTLLVIALLFYFTHRCWRPLFWLIALLIAILAGTLALGGLVYGTLSVVSLGFASILIGLAEDFGIVLYQESRTHPHLTVAEIRHEAAPGIYWSALTTAGAFLLLNFSGLPGLGQLGTLVAIGVGLAAVLMLYAYLPPLLRREKRGNAREDIAGSLGRNEAGAGETPATTVDMGRGGLLFFTAALVAGGIALLLLRPPKFDQSPDALRPRNSAAYAALDEIKTRLDRPREPLWVVIQGRDEAEVARRLTATDAILQRAVSNQVISSVTLPTALWPQMDHQAANRAAALGLSARSEELQAAILAAGFTSNSVGLAAGMFDQWQRAGVSTGAYWPTNDNSRWILEKLSARSTNALLAIGLVHPRPGPLEIEPMNALATELRGQDVSLSGWELLGPEVSQLVRRDLKRVLLPILALVLVTLWLAFRTVKDLLLSLATLVVSGVALHLVMVLTGWTWNMMNLMALPLLLGIGVDFSIHIQLALRRHHGDTGFVRRSVGRALLLAGSTTVAGFASLSFASNAGIAALGKVCALGIMCAMLTAVYLLPLWWRMAAERKLRSPQT